MTLLDVLDILMLGALALVAFMMGLLAIQDFRLHKKIGVSLIFPYFCFAGLLVLILEILFPQLPRYSAMVVIMAGWPVLFYKYRRDFAEIVRERFGKKAASSIHNKTSEGVA